MRIVYDDVPIVIKINNVNITIMKVKGVLTMDIYRNDKCHTSCLEPCECGGSMDVVINPDDGFRHLACEICDGTRCIK